jgi:hypothetical protein
MGDIADMMLDGTLDEVTGEYLGEGPGYPRSNDPGHYSNDKRSDNYGNNPGSGVKQWLSTRGIKKNKRYAMVLDYVRTINPAINENSGINKLSQKYIQNDFHNFTKYVLKRIKDES